MSISIACQIVLFTLTLQGGCEKFVTLNFYVYFEAMPYIENVTIKIILESIKLSEKEIINLKSENLKNRM